MTATVDAPAEPSCGLTTGDVNTALGRLCSLGITKVCDWIMQPGRGDRCERPAVEALIRDVCALSPWQMGYDVPPGERGPAALARQRLATRTMLLLRWNTDPVYAESDDDDAPPEE